MPAPPGPLRSSEGRPGHRSFGMIVDVPVFDARAFPYDNRTGREPGRFVRALGGVLPGVARVRATAEPYAQAWRAANLRVLGGTARRWFVLGDSMAQGVGAPAFDRGLVGQLARRLSADGDELGVVNLSATGARVPDLLDQQLPLLDALPPAGPAGPDLVTVLAGSNDLFGGRRHRDALPAAMARLVDRLPPGAVVATLPQPRAAARAANRHIEAAAADGRIRMVDLRTAGPDTWRGRLAPDFFHPNEAGHAALAAAFEPVVRRALREDG